MIEKYKNQLKIWKIKKTKKRKLKLKDGKKETKTKTEKGN